MTSIPAPQLTVLWAWTLAVSSLTVGVVLLLAGDKIHRVALLFAGAALGLVLGGKIASLAGLSPTGGRIIGAVILGLVGLIGARLVWAALAATLAFIAAGWAVSHLATVADAAKEAPPGAPETILAWLEAAWLQYKTAIGRWGERPIAVLMILLPATLVPLVIGLIRPRLARILMTVLLGAGCVMFGLLLGAGQISPAWWTAGMDHLGVLAAAMVVLMLAGLIVQYRCALAAERKEDHREAEPVDEKKDKKPTRDAKTKTDASDSGDGE